MIHANYKKESLEARKILEKSIRRSGMRLSRQNPDLILCIGGDGTMLSAIRKYRELRVPFVGLNTGTLGFLPGIDMKDIDSVAEKLKNGEYHVEDYPVIKVECKTIRGDNTIGYAFNEVLIKHVSPRLMEAKVYINEKPFNYFTGDGFIVSTPIGSTGYAIWAGGAATHSALKAFQLIPLHPNDNSINRPLKSSMVIPIDTKIDINIVKAEKRKVIVACDGIKVSNDYISDIQLSASHEEVKILRLNEHDYFDLFRTKIIDKQIKRSF